MNKTIACMAVLACACGRPDADTWLMVAAGDTVTIGEAGANWDSMPIQGRVRFLESDNLVGDYIVSLGQKILVEAELDRLGYTSRPDIVFQRLARARLTMAGALQDSIHAAAARDVTEDRIDRFLENLGTIVWLTRTTGRGDSLVGPEHLPELPEDWVASVEEMAAGRALTGTLADGSTIRLDSIHLEDPELLAQALADTAQIRDYAASRLSQRTAAAEISSLRSRLWEESRPAFVESAFRGLMDYYAGRSPSIPDDTLIVSGAGVWTAAQMVGEIGFEAATNPVSPAESTWLYAYAKVVVDRANLSGEYARLFPAESEAALAAAAEWALGIAADSLFMDFVADSVEVTEAQIDSAWQADPPPFPERRSVRTVIIPEDRLEEFRNALAAGTAGDLEQSLPSIERLSDPDGSDAHLTRPLFIEEVPGSMGESLFAMSPSDTLRWLPPQPYAPDIGYVSIRLVSVVPEHTATREEAGYYLDRQLYDAFIGRRLEVWLTEMEERFGLEVNEEVLDDLPPNPSDWTRLNLGG
jgi:hypothetical protein